MAQLSLSLFAAGILKMNEDLQATKNLEISSLHVDIMDGHFVPLFGLNPVWLRQIKNEYPMNQDFHFMAYMTNEMLEPYLALKPMEITIHLEAGKEEENLKILQIIKKEKIRAGIAISPESNYEKIMPYIKIVDEVLVMSTFPGREDAKFVYGTFEKIKNIRQLIDKSNRKIILSVDGGLDQEKALQCIKNGADRIIMGRAFFNSDQKMKLTNEITKASNGNR